MDFPKFSLSQPPPTIWNVNTILKEPEGIPSKTWFTKLETITEVNRKKELETKSNGQSSKIPLACSGFGGSFQHRSEPVTLKVPTTTKESRQPPTTGKNGRRHGERKMTNNRAAVVIQRAFRNYMANRNVVPESKPQTTISERIQKSSKESKNKKDGRDRSEDKSKYPVHTCRSLTFKDYLREGSLFFLEREAVLVFGGIDPHSKYGDGRNTGRNIFRYHSEYNQWDLVGELPQPRHHHAVAFLKGKVYLAGGTDPRDDEKGKSVVVGTVWSFDPVTRAWYKEREMLTPRKNFGLVVMNGKLVAIGGQDKDGKILASVERYDPASGKWEYIASLNTERTGAAAARYNDTVWVAGGMTGSRRTPLTSSVESYDAKYNVWIEQPCLRFPRCFGCLFATNDTLYFIGGAGRASEKEKTTSSCNAIDLWNPKEQEWKLHFAMSIPRHGHAVAYLGTQILIIGGVTTAYLRALTDVECFCCERKTWVKGLTVLPVPLSGHGAVTLPPASLM